MKALLKRDDVSLEYEHQPMQGGRFRALCLLAAIGIYAGMVVAVANACGLPGLIVVGVVTLLCGLMACLSD